VNSDNPYKQAVDIRWDLIRRLVEFKDTNKVLRVKDLGNATASE